MALEGRQIRQLRSLAHHLNPVIIVGKSDVNDGTVEQANEALEAHELIKCSVLDTSSLSAREAANELAERCHAEVVQVIGRKFSIYRETSRDDVEKIKLV
ncbi:MAG TPA: ribosome assembly RNA-binding protein YhbY [Candidatus Limicola stercorigallinarum]|nr:ribosome assembly RNA-binding protein YhbY [Candidatus Limicola stercorigallinarum]